MTQHVYSSSVFDVSNLDQAKNIILTPEGGSTEERWAKETPVIVRRIVERSSLGPNSLVVDYGCGIGRVAKELISQTGCRVIGVDISASMRALGAVYVGSPNFLACAPEFLAILGVKADVALAIWVLQHCYKPQDDIALIHDALAIDGRLFVLNNVQRAVPTIERTWVSDGLDVNALLEQDGFSGGIASRLPEDVCPPGLAAATYWREYDRRELAVRAA